MLRIISRRSLQNPSIWVPDVQVRFCVPNRGASGASLYCRIDTGADRTVISLAHARAVGLTEDEVKRGKPVRLNPVVGNSVQGYSLTVRLSFQDHFGGVMEWDGEVTFYDGKKDLLGWIGFIEFFRKIAIHRRHTDMEPRDPSPSEYIHWQCGQQGVAVSP